MTEDDTPDEQRINSSDDPESEWTTSRRRMLGLAAATGFATGVGPFNFGQQATRIELLGVTGGWEVKGDASASYVSGDSTVNPTLQLEAGQDYEVVWENGDGAPHNFVVIDGNGNNVVRTDIMSEEGTTQSVSFTATEDMVEYLCEVHPSTMVGDIETTAGDQATTDTQTDTDEQQTERQRAGFFAKGTEVGYQTVAEGMTAPTSFAVANEEQDRHFVTDQTGELWVVTPEEGRQDEPFIDISDRMVELGTFYGDYASSTQDYDERGLLGVEFHPDFQNNGRFYLHYSAPPSDELAERGWDHVEVVSEFQASDDLSSGDPGSEKEILSIPSPQYNHDSGPIAFGPDGYLYVPMGDGGGANDNMYGHVGDWYDRNEGGNGQNITENMLGDILRVDVDNQEDGKNYAIPEDNPFAGEDSLGLDEIYAYGFRNPFGISFDSQGNLFVADAGQNLWEEVNLVEKGGNYGWNVKEGTHCFSTEEATNVTAITDCPTHEPDTPPFNGGELIDPIAEYPHQYEGNSVGIVVVGGHRYENDTIAGLQGKYVFGDWSADPRREEPAGRVLAATPPEGFDGETADAATAGDTNATTTDGMNATATDGMNATTTDDGNASVSGDANVSASGEGNATTGDDTNATASGDANATATGDANATASDGDSGMAAGNKTVPEGEDGNQTATGDKGTQSETGAAAIGEDDIPRDQLWDMEELMFPDGFEFFVRQFGRDSDGELYVLVNRKGVPEGDTGRVVKLVPPEEGETPSGTETATGTGNETATDENGTSTTGNESAVNGNATDTAGNDTATNGNATQ